MKQVKGALIAHSPGEEAMNDSQRVALTSLYDKALSEVSRNPQAMKDVNRARHLNPASTTSSDFMREYAWVVFVSGFRVNTVRKKMPRLTKVFKNWNHTAISRSKSAVRTQALQILKNPKKVDAVLKAAEFVKEESWPVIKKAVLKGMVRTSDGSCYPSAHFFDYINTAYVRRDLPWMGLANRRYLAKNLGFDLAKNDRHLTRLAGQYRYSADASGVQRFVEDVACCVAERVSVVETVLWNTCEAGAI